MLVGIQLPANAPQSVNKMKVAPTVEEVLYKSGAKAGQVKEYYITCEWEPDPLAGFLGFGVEANTVVHVCKTKEAADKTLDYWTQIYHDPSLMYDEDFQTSFMR